MSKAPIRTTLKDGQPYVDEPVYAVPKPIDPLERELAKAFARKLPEAFNVGYERKRFRWMTIKDGAIVPRKP